MKQSEMSLPLKLASFAFSFLLEKSIIGKMSDSPHSGKRGQQDAFTGIISESLLTILLFFKDSLHRYSVSQDRSLT
jgi:hypothetical protein